MTWTLIHAVAESPLVAVARVGAEDRQVLHGVTAAALAAHTALQAPLRAACGQVAVLTSVEGELLRWPPYAQGIAPLRRCRTCHDTLGRMRPRTTLAITRSLAALVAEKWGVLA